MLEKIIIFLNKDKLLEIDLGNVNMHFLHEKIIFYCFGRYLNQKIKNL